VAGRESTSMMQSVGRDSRTLLVFPAAQRDMFDVHHRQIPVIPNAKRVNRVFEI